MFSNANINIIFASFSGGHGVVDPKSGTQTYMKMGDAGIRLGLGVKDFRAVFIFHTRADLDRFVNSGWEFGGHADAAAKASDKGAAVGGEALLDGITIYQLTKSGLALQATVKGTKYLEGWRAELSLTMERTAEVNNSPRLLVTPMSDSGHLAKRDTGPSALKACLRSAIDGLHSG